MKPRCPHCDAEALYVGLERLECPTRGCSNHRATGEGAELPQRSVEILDIPFDLFAQAHLFF